MISCTSWLGHKWSGWTLSKGGPVKDKDGRFYRQAVQKRHCLRCEYHQTEWLNEHYLVEDKDDILGENKNNDDEKVH